MAEQRFEVKVYAVDYICDTCGTGKMYRHGNIIALCDPPLFPHKCDNPTCGAQDSFRENYPTVRYERAIAN